jgi:hypothetical protein
MTLTYLESRWLTPSHRNQPSSAVGLWSLKRRKLTKSMLLDDLAAGKQSNP